MKSVQEIDKSHPTWVRGLKQSLSVSERAKYGVAPYVGAWIETPKFGDADTCPIVAPYVGAWIETKAKLKNQKLALRRTLRGCVD